MNHSEGGGPTVKPGGHHLDPVEPEPGGHHKDPITPEPGGSRLN
ncbi:hypothetical protein ACSVDA_10885 [Cytobacillus sp. Hm23]